MDSLATEIGLSLANASQHLQALRQAALVDSRKDGLFVYYRLAGPEVFELSRVLRTGRGSDGWRSSSGSFREHFGDRADAEAVPMDELLKRARSKQVVILDTRPASEYVAGHIPGAISVPVDELKRRLQAAHQRQGIRRLLSRPVLRLRRSRRRTAPRAADDARGGCRRISRMAGGGSSRGERRAARSASET